MNKLYIEVNEQRTFTIVLEREHPYGWIHDEL